MTIKEQVSAHDKQIKAIRDLVKEGMKLVVETRRDLRDLAAAQKRTEASLDRLIKTLGWYRNGKGKP